MCPVVVAIEPADQAKSAGVAADSASPEPILSLDWAQQLLRALAEPIRLRVVQALQQGERCVCDLTGDLDLAQSKLSFHLKVLKEAGLICARQEGRWIYYRLEPSALLLLRDWLGQLAAACQSPATPCS
jgi:ArsR family transcriptional regulator